MRRKEPYPGIFHQFFRPQLGLTGFGGLLSIVHREVQLRHFPNKVMPKRWIVERSWLEKNRRLWKNCERLLNTSLQFVHLAFLAMLIKRF